MTCPTSAPDDTLGHKTKARGFLAVLLAPCLLYGAEPQRSLHPAGPLTLGSLLESEISRGCGCYFRVPPEKKEKGSDILQWEDGELASLFVDGELVRLKVETDMPYSNRLGETFEVTLSSPGTSVRADLRSSWVCPNESQGCEASQFVGTLTVTRSKNSGALKVWGSCGC